MSGPRSAGPHSGRRQDVLREAAAWVGYREGRGNDNVFGRMFGENLAPWCAMFVAEVVELAGATPDAVVPHTASCDTAMRWYKLRGRFGATPRVGAQVFYGIPGDAQHTGLVERVGRLFIVTVEGNTNAAGGREGDGVYRKRRLRRSARILGYGYPAYPSVGLNGRRRRARRRVVVRPGATLATIAAAAGITVTTLVAGNPQLGKLQPRPGVTLNLPPAPAATRSTSSPAPTPTSRPPAPRHPPAGRAPAGLHYGQRGPRVRALQLELRRLGWRIPDPLGRYGPYTRAAVRAYQRRHRTLCPCDGLAGPRTVASILRRTAA